jgi:hypothetical protein
MAKEYKPDEWATRIFVMSMAAIAAWIVAAFSFVILAN